MVDLMGAIAQGATISIVIKGIDNFSNTFKKANSGIGGLTTAAKVGATAVLSMGAAITAIGVSAAKSAIQAEPMSKSFQKLADDSDNFLKSLNESTKGTVSNFELMSNANKALLLGLDQEILPDLFKNAAIVGRAAGRSTTESIQDITLGIGRQSKLILDNLGIIVRAEEAYESYATSIGKLSSELTDDEKRIAFTNAAMESLNKKAADLGGTLEEDLGVKLQQLQKNFSDVKVELGNQLIPPLLELSDIFLIDLLPAIQPLIPILADLLVGALEMIVPYIPKLIEGFQRFAQLILERLFPALEPLMPVLFDLAMLFMDIGLDLLEALMPGLEAIIPPLAELLLASTPIVQVLGEFLKLVGWLVTAVGTEFSKVLIDVLPGLKKWWEWLGNIKDVITSVIDLVKKLIDWIGKININPITNITNVASKVLGGSKTKKVNDAIITPQGRVIETAPDDYLIATKNPMGASVIINGPIYGVDPKQISIALSKELGNKLSL